MHISHVLKINMRITLGTNQAHLGLRRNDRQPRYRGACSSLLHAARSVYTGAHGSDATYAAAFTLPSHASQTHHHLFTPGYQAAAGYLVKPRTVPLKLLTTSLVARPSPYLTSHLTMAGKFFEDLWESIFTPGPTPTLLIATNASFAALQLLFFALFIGTYSIHFVILSFLTGGLWYGINWFAREIRIAQKAEEEAKRIRAERRGSQKEAGDGDQADVDTGDETEVEVNEDTQKQTDGLAKQDKNTVLVDRPDREQTPQAAASVVGGGPAAASTTGAETRLAPLVDDALKQRKGGLGESTGDLSTDSEWDKLSEDSGER